MVKLPKTARRKKIIVYGFLCILGSYKNEKNKKKWRSATAILEKTHKKSVLVYFS